MKLILFFFLKNHLKQMDHFGSGNATFFSKLFVFNFATLKGLRGKWNLNEWCFQ